MLQRHAVECLLDGWRGVMALGEGIGREFGVAFPLQAEAAEVMEEELGLAPWRGHAEMAAQAGQEAMLDRAVGGAGRLAIAGIDSQMGNRLGAMQVQEGTGMDFSGQRHAHIMVETGKNHGRRAQCRMTE